MKTAMSRESVGELVNEVADCVRRVVAVDPMYRHYSGGETGDRALDFVTNMPWSREPDRERSLADLVDACAGDPRESDAPTRLVQAVADGQLGEATAWHALDLAAGGFHPDLVVAYVGGTKPAWLTQANTRQEAPVAGGSDTRFTSDSNSGDMLHTFPPDAGDYSDGQVSDVVMPLRVEGRPEVSSAE